MRKIETIWHYLLFSALEAKKYRYTQQEIAQKFAYSLSTVNFALKAPAEIGAIRKETKFFVLADFKKLLYFWASQRNLSRDIIYRTYSPAAITEIEGLIPAGAIYACYSAARRILGEPPADYSAVHCYADEKILPEFKKRFPAGRKHEPNVVILKALKTMEEYGGLTTLPQTFVDIWNLKDWYSRDFIERLEQKIDAVLS